MRNKNKLNFSGDRDSRWNNQNRDNGFHAPNRYQQNQHRSNYGAQNQDRQMNYHENRSYNQQRPQFRSSPPSTNHSSYNSGPNRNYNVDENAHDLHQAPSNVNVNADAVKAKPDENPPVIVEKLLDKNNYNPPELDIEKLETAR